LNVLEVKSQLVFIAYTQFRASNLQGMYMSQFRNALNAAEAKWYNSLPNTNQKYMFKI